MGVVYKLKKEVIDYIVEQKRLDPNLSCRKIVLVIKERFQTDVSKSAVNAVIKQADLSSPVGRKPKAGKKSQKFKIPDEKKVQILTSLVQENLLLDRKDDLSKVPEIKADFAVTGASQQTLTPQGSLAPSDEPPQKPAKEAEELSKEKVIAGPSPEQEKPDPFIILQGRPPEPPQAVESPEKEKETPVISEVQMAKEEAIQESSGLPAAEETEPTQEIKETVSPPLPASLPDKEEPTPVDREPLPAPTTEEKGAPALAANETESPPPPILSDEEEEPGLQEKAEEPLRLLPDPLAQLTLPPEETTQEPPAQEEKPIAASEPIPAPAPVIIESKDSVRTPEVPQEAPAANGDAPAQQPAVARDDSVEIPKAPEKTPPVGTPNIPEAEPDVKKPAAVDAPQKSEAEPAGIPDAATKYTDDKIWTPDSSIFFKQKIAVGEVFDDETILHPGLGNFFLKAAEWELSNSPILGGILGRHVSGYLPFDVGVASEVLLYLEAFDIKKLEDIKDYTQDGPWLVNGLKQKLNYEMLVRLVESVQGLKSLSLTMVQEYSQVFSETGYIKLTLADHTAVFIDAQLKTVWPENAVHPVFTVPLNKSLVYLSTNFIGNTQPVFISHIPGYKNFAKQFYEMFWAFEDIADKHIVNIAIFDTQRTQIAHFSVIPRKKRSFVVGAWPWQEECKKFIADDIRLIKHFFHEGLQQEIFYSELKTSLGQPMVGQSINVRVGLLRETGLGWPVMIILTNIPEEGMPMEEVIAAYLAHWPNAQEGYNDFTAKAEKASYGAVSMIPSPDKVALLEGSGTYNLLDGSADLWKNIRFLLSGINNYCQRHFFPPHYEQLEFPTIKQRFYSLPGYLRKGPNYLSVRLVPPPDYPYRKDLEYALRRLNESDIKDYSGLKLHIGTAAPRK